MKRCRGGLKVKRCRSAQVHRCRRSRGAGAQVQAQKRWCRAGAEPVQRSRGMEEQRCRGAQTQIDGEVVQRCRHGAVVQG